MKSGRPLVVLAGWMGSQPKSLRRYERLYRRIGFDVVLTCIATPLAVVQSVLNQPRRDVTPAPDDVPTFGRPNYRRNSVQQETITTVRDLAWDVLNDVHHHGDDCSAFYFHAFSNGGCFVWEQIRNILLLAPSSDNRCIASNVEQRTELLSSETLEILSGLREKLAGVVFDSCPIAELDRLSDALKYCSWTERAAVVRHCGLDFQLFAKGNDPEIQERVQSRIQSYVTGLRHDPLLIPQLYLYSRDDPLTPSPFIDELVQHRRDVSGSNRVMSRVWDESLHCSHLLKHSDEYTAAVEAFVKLVATETKVQRSKL